MDSKQTIAIAVVAVLIIAGVGVGIFFATKDNSSNTVDKVKETVDVGDKIKLNLTSYNEDEGTEDDFLAYMYYYEGLGEKIDETKIQFDGKEYDCIVYEVTTPYPSKEYKTKVFAVKDSDFILKQEGYIMFMGFEGTFTVKEINKLDVTKKIDEQSIEDGAYYGGKFESTNMKADIRMTYSNEDGNEKIELTQTVEATFEVTKKTKDGKLVINNDDQQLMDEKEFRSYVSLSDWKEWKQEQGFEVVDEGEKEYKTVKTPFGDRHVAIQSIQMKNAGDVTMTYTLTYGDEGFLYSCFSDGVVDSLTTVIETSMIA